MKTKFNGILTLLLALVVQISFAQEKTVSGTVSDESGGLPQVSILIKGTKKGTETDFDGKYSIKAKAGDVLVFSYIGYKTVEKTVGTSNAINVTLKSGEVLDEIVVIALGISKEKKKLGYSVETVKGDQIAKAAENNIVNALQGKVSGVDIINSGGEVGASSNIVIRGISSINGNNQALFVVDGVPIDNSTLTSGGVIGTNRASDIDFNNVKSISVLKGAAAMTLYGSRASNGAIIITTKKGKNNGKLNITLNSLFSFDRVNKLPEFQQSFARGRNGAYSNVTHWSWGPNYADNPTFPSGTFVDLNGTGTREDVSGQEIPFYADNYKRFWQDGSSNTLSLSASGGTEKSNFYTSVSHSKQDGIVKGTDYERNNFLVNGTVNITDKFTVGGSANYIQAVRNSVAGGLNGYGWGLGYWHNMWDINRNWIAPDGSPTWFSGSVPDPNWIINEESEYSSVDRLIGNVNFSYNFNKWFNISYRLGIDTYGDSRSKVRPRGSVRTSGNTGDIYERRATIRDINSDFIISGDGNLNDDFGFSYKVGNNIYDSYYNNITTTGTDLTIPGFAHLSNAVNITVNQYTQESRFIGFFGEATFDYKDIIYLGLSSRTDISSTLPSGKNVFTYPSANLSFLFGKLLNDTDFINFGKFRASYATVGKAPGVFRTNEISVVQYDPNNVLGSLPAFTVSNGSNDPSLEPELSNEYELGLEMKFLDNKLGFDFAYYNKLSDKQHISIPISSTTGFSSIYTNAGKVRNSGIELSLFTHDLIDLGKLKWDINASFTKNKNIVETLPDGIDEIVIANGYWSNTSLVARPGLSAGTIVGTGYQRDDQGNILINSSTGNPVLTNERIVLGDIFADWKLNISGNFKYKGFTLSYLFDIKKGGDIINDSEGWWAYSGLSKSTENRFYPGVASAQATTVINGVLATDTDGDGIFTSTGNPNNIAVPLTNSYYHNYLSFNDEALVEDASWVRLRNISLFYQLPSNFLKNTSFTSLEFGVIGRNLWLNTKYKGVDPEVNGYGAGNGQGFDILGAPGTKSVSLNVKVKF